MAYRRTSDNLDSLRAAARQRPHYEDGRRGRVEETRRAPRDPNAMGPSEEVMERRRRARRHPVTTAAGREGGTMTENLILLAALIGSLCALYHFCIRMLSQGL